MQVSYHTIPVNKFIPRQPQTKERGAKPKASYLCTVDNKHTQEEISGI